MIQLTLHRTDAGDEGTRGELYDGAERLAYTMEPPWRDNQRNISCIPNGTYSAVWHRSPKYGWCYTLVGVPGRSHVLIHPGNWGGDRAMGKRTNTQGCILLGTVRAVLAAQKAVGASRTAVRRFHDRTGGKPLEITVQG